MVNSRLIIDLDPLVQPICQKHVDLCKQQGIEIIITSTWRDFEEQDVLYAIGRTKDLDKHPVTNARAGQSWHNFRCAWDVVPIVGGKAIWNDKDPVWKMVVLNGKTVGAEAGADFKSFPDLPHFQVRPINPHGSGFMELAQAGANFQKTGSIFTA